MTQANFQVLLSEFEQQIVSEIHGTSGSVDSIPSQTITSTSTINKHTRWHHPSRGKHLSVPVGFVFPKLLTIKPCWDFYLYGNLSLLVRPFRLLTPKDLFNHAERCRLPNMKVICKFIMQHSSAATDVLQMSTTATDEVFREKVG